jgi:hypothetical protein
MQLHPQGRDRRPHGRHPAVRLDRRRRSAQAVLLGLAAALALAQAPGPRPAAAQASGHSLLGSAPAEIRAEAEMEGSPELVWYVLTDLPRYPVWNPFLYPVEGELRPGRTLEVTVHSGTLLATYQATVLKVERDRLLSWSGQAVSPGVFTTIFSFSIEPAGRGRVRLVSRETRQGLAPIVEWLFGPSIQTGLNAMTLSARNRVELLRTTGSPWWRPPSFHIDEVRRSAP